MGLSQGGQAEYRTRKIAAMRKMLMVGLRHDSFTRAAGPSWELVEWSAELSALLWESASFGVPLPMSCSSYCEPSGKCAGDGASTIVFDMFAAMLLVGARLWDVPGEQTNRGLYICYRRWRMPSKAEIPPSAKRPRVSPLRRSLPRVPFLAAPLRLNSETS